MLPMRRNAPYIQYNQVARYGEISYDEYDDNRPLLINYFYALSLPPEDVLRGHIVFQ
jgi:hypothetical protein